MDRLAALPKGTSVQYYRGNTDDEVDGITQWAALQTLQSVRYTNRSFDYMRPSYNFEASSRLQATTYTVEKWRYDESRQIPAAPMEVFESLPYGYPSSDAGYDRARLRTQSRVVQLNRLGTRTSCFRVSARAGSATPALTTTCDEPGSRTPHELYGQELQRFPSGLLDSAGRQYARPLSANRAGCSGASMLNLFAKSLLFIAGVSACSIAFSGEPTMSNALLSRPRPWCIGRFVFDRPAASEISNQRYEFEGDKLETRYNVSQSAYQAKIEGRESELRSKKRVYPGDGKERNHSWLEKAFSPTSHSRVFIYRDTAAEGIDLPFDSEGYVFDNGTLFGITGRIGSSAIGKVERIYDNEIRRIKARDNWSVPPESGFCFDGGIVTGSSTTTEEVSQSFALMPGRPALLVIQMRDSVEQDQSAPLTKTLPALRAQLSRQPGHYRILREGKRIVAGMNAEEVLFELQDSGITSYRFYLLAPGDPSTLAKPHTAIQLLLGASSPDLTPEQATSPVDEAGALQVWDTLLNSLRLRPGAV